MNILVVMVPLSILLLIGAGVAFFWAVDHDQFDDLDTPRLLPLEDAPAKAQVNGQPAQLNERPAQAHEPSAPMNAQSTQVRAPATDETS